MKNIPWDSYQIFLAVARAGSLSAAADRIGLSSATIGRRMLELERQMECALFVRSQTGYSLTGGGQALLDHLFRRADRCLYIAKREGRNRVHLDHGPVIEPGQAVDQRLTPS